MAEVSQRVALFGTEEPPAKAVRLRAGPVTVELENGSLRHGRYQGVEVLRGIAYLLRDEGWGTPVPDITNLKIGQGPDSFQVSYDGRCESKGQEYVYHAEITGRRDGRVRFEVRGRAVTDVVTNRLGFVVLHPLEGVAGRPVEVTHTDGTVERARFPRLISPDQPFFDVKALAHEVVPGVRATCVMEGDAFEVEDHRNWMDASYKTYIRPLSKPRPFTLAAGETTAQSVELSFSGEPRPQTAGSDAPLTVAVGERAGTMPRIGLGVPWEEAAAALEVQALLRPVRPGFLVGQLDLRAPASAAALAHLKALADALQAPVVLEIVLPNELPPEEELARAAQEVHEAGLALEAAHPSPQEYLRSWQPDAVWPEVPPLEEIYAAAHRTFRGVGIGGGMLSYFTELNRKRPSAESIDFVSHTTTAIVHDCDDRTVMENLEALPWIAESVQALAPGTPYRVGPSAIGMRQNPYGAEPCPNPGNRRIPMAWNDPRQRGLFGAAWNLGYVARLAAAGAEAVALSAPTGPFGIVYRRADFPQPWFDERGGVYPLYHVIRGLAAAAGQALLATTVSDPATAQALAFQREGGVELWLANLTGSPITVAVERLGDQGDIARLDLDTFAAATAGPNGFGQGAARRSSGTLELGSYAVARIRAAG